MSELTDVNAKGDSKIKEWDSKVIALTLMNVKLETISA